MVTSVSVVGATPALGAEASPRWERTWPEDEIRFNALRDIAVDATGNLYVADSESPRIEKLDPSGARLATCNLWDASGGRPTDPQQAPDPYGVAVDATGNVYVADMGNNRIQKFSSSGVFITKWGAYGTGNGQFRSPCVLAVDATGNVYVADAGNSRIQKFSSSGVFITKWGAYGTGNGQFRSPCVLAVDATGNVYVADAGNSRIQKFSSSGVFITKWGSLGSGNGQFETPRGLAVDATGNVYVADAGISRIQKFSSSGVFITKWGAYGTGNGQFRSPYGLAVDATGNVYVADAGNNRIEKFSSSGAFLTKWESDGTGDGQFQFPSGIAVDATGNVYVADAGNNRIQKFSSSGAFITKWGAYGTGDSQFSDPAGIAVDAAGDVYVTDAGNGRIQKFSSSGTFITKWGSESTGDGFNRPRGIAVDASGNVYVADTGNHRIQKFSSSGTFLTKWGLDGTADGFYPAGIAVDAAGDVYVTEQGNHGVQKFSSSGTFLTKWGSYGTGDSQFAYPRGIAVDAVGDVYVTDLRNHRIQKFSSSGTFIGKWGSGGTGEGQFGSSEGIAVDSTGSVYVSEVYNHRIQKFTYATFDVVPTAGAHGTITPDATQTVNSGADSAPFIITPDAGYHVADVLVGGASVGAVSSYRFSDVTADNTISAVFAIDTHTLTYTAGSGGSIVGSTTQVVDYDTGGTAITAKPAVGYHFVKWSDDSVANPRTDTSVKADKAVSAIFAVDTFTIYALPSSDGTITPSSQSVDHDSDSTSITIAPNAGYHFVSASDKNGPIGTVAGTVTGTREFKFTGVRADNTISAVLAIDTHTLSYTAGAGGSIEGSTTQVVDYDTDGTAVTAKPATGYHFVKWSDDSVANPRTDTSVKADKAISAIFAVDTFTLTYTAGTGGSIEGSTTQVVDYDTDGTAVTAKPATGYHFMKWSDDSLANTRTDTGVKADRTLRAVFAVDESIPGVVTRIAGATRFDVAANLARKGWDPANTKAWTGVKHVIVANGENGKEADPLAAAGLAGAYDCPVLLTAAASLPAATKTTIAEIAKKNPGLRVHIIGGTGSVPDARWTQIKAIPGVSATKDRIAGATRYDVSAAIANRIVTVVTDPDDIEGVILVAADSPAAFYDALAASPIAYSNKMPMLAVQKGSVPPSVAAVLKSTALKSKPRYAASSATYIGAGSLSTAIRLTTSANRYTAANEIAKKAIAMNWATPMDTGLAAKLPDALTGGTYLGKRGGLMLFTDSTGVIQSASKSFITEKKSAITNGWVIGGTGSVPPTQEISFRNLLK